MNPESFHEKFKQARIAALLTQGEAAEKLRVAKRAVQNWEVGQATPIYPAQVGALAILKRLRPRSR